MSLLTTEILPENASRVDEIADSDLLQRWPAEQLLALNLDSLRQKDAALADTIAAQSLPEDVEMVLARDGSVTFRLVADGGRRDWLGYSSVPLISARSNADLITVDATNMAFNGIGHGAEVQFLLERLAPYQALIVTESDPLKLNLALRLRDFSQDLALGRLVLLLGPDPAELFQEFLTNNPGYNIASQAMIWTWLTTQENKIYADELSRATENYVSQIINTVSDLLAQQKEIATDAFVNETRKLLSAGDLSSLRVANYTNTYHPTDYITAHGALTGLEQLGVATDLMSLNRPEIVANHAQITRMNRVEPHLIILVDMLRGDVGFSLPEYAVCATFLQEPPARLFEAGATAKLGPHDFVFSCLDQHLQELREAGFPALRTHHLPLAVDAELFHPYEPVDTDRRSYGTDVALIAERHDTDPAAWQINLPTHQRLWQEVASLIERAPGKYHGDLAGQYLTRAQQCGVVLRETDIKQHFTELIANYLGPAVQRDAYVAALAEIGVGVRIWNPVELADTAVGRRPCFWADSPVKHCYTGPVNHGPQSNALYNCAKISLHLSSTGCIIPGILEAVAAGTLCLVKANTDDRRSDGIGRFFDLDRELITFDTPKDMIRKVRYYLSHDAQREQVALAARQKLLARHTVKQRLREMLDFIRDNLPT